ncbi:MAG TPA: SBBP repeat-containing protein [Bryobacteraceae bacterium]|nr:SBBP repeat-containing protein [Bryobacteraceae bacterium]
MAQASPNKPASPAQISRDYGQLPLIFEKNEGQTDSQVQFVSRAGGATVYLTGSETVMALYRPGPSTSSDAGVPKNRLASGRRMTEGWQQSVVRMKFPRSNPAPRAEGLERLPGISNYFIGADPAKWHTNIPQYAKVRYHDVYAGIDMVYYGDGRNLEYDFVVAPGADPNAIRLAFEGVDRLYVAVNGDLTLKVGEGELRLRKPMVYQALNGKRVEVAGSYQVLPGRQVRFALAGYNPGSSLTIDPVLVYATYLGGSAKDAALGIAVDGSGSAYLVGGTQSLDFRTVAGSYRTTKPTSSNNVNTFVSKMNSAGTQLLYSTYLGGSGSDQSQGIAVDSSGNACVTGFTNSSNFPTVAAIQAQRNGPDDAFITKLNSAGSALLFSTYLGGSTSTAKKDSDPYQDGGLGIAVDANNNIYVLGETASTDFPVTAGVYQSVLNGSHNFFVTKLNSTGSAKVYATYLGGEGYDTIAARIKVDSNTGEVYLTGYSTSQHYPTTTGAYQRQSGGGQDVVITKLNSTATSLDYSTYLGGSGDEGSQAISDADPVYGPDIALAVDGSGDVFVAGQSSSTNFPVTNQSHNKTGVTIFGDLNGTANGGGYAVGALQGNSYVDAAAFTTGAQSYTMNQIQALLSFSSGTNDMTIQLCNDSGGIPGSVIESWDLNNVLGTSAAVVTMNSATHPILSAGKQYWITAGMVNSASTGVWYFNSSRQGLATTSVNGGSFSPAASTTSGFYAFSVSTQGSNFFVTKLNPAGSSLLFSTFFGGSGFDYVHGMATDSTGDVYITGGTTSTDFPLANAEQAQNAGGYDAFVVKLSPDGQTLLFSTYFGGSGNDDAGDIAVGPADGRIYISGNASLSVNFPSSKTASPFPFGGGAGDAFVAKLAQADLKLSLSVSATGSVANFREAAAGTNGWQRAADVVVKGGGTVVIPGQTTNNGSDGADNTKTTVKAVPPGCVTLGTNCTSTNPAVPVTCTSDGQGGVVASAPSLSPGQTAGFNMPGQASSNSGTCTVTGNTLSDTDDANTGDNSSSASFTVGIPVTVDTVPPGIIQVAESGGQSFPTPHTFGWTAGSQHTIVVPQTSQSSDGKTQYVFVSWEDNSTSASRTVTAPSSATNYTATYRIQYLLHTTVSPAGSGAVSSTQPAGFLNAGTSVTLTAVPNAGNQFFSWAGASGGPTNPLTITMTAPVDITAYFTASAVPVSMSPASGTGTTQTFTATFSDPAGFQDIGVADILINNFIDGRVACYLAYVPAANTLYLVDDGGHAGGPFAGQITLNGSATAMQNSQCQVNGTGSSAVGSGNTLTLTLNITFKSPFGGNQIFYLGVVTAAGNSSGWCPLGVWQVPGAAPGQITVSSASPGRGSGRSAAYTLTFTDTKGAADMGIVNLLMNNAIDGRQACYLAYRLQDNTLFLVDDKGDAGGPFAGTTALGAGIITNSQCSVSGSAVQSGNTLTLNLNLSFQPGFIGNRVIYLAGRDTADGHNTGWQALATWTVQ